MKLSFLIKIYLKSKWKIKNGLLKKSLKVPPRKTSGDGERRHSQKNEAK